MIAAARAPEPIPPEAEPVVATPFAPAAVVDTACVVMGPTLVEVVVLVAVVVEVVGLDEVVVVAVAVVVVVVPLRPVVTDPVVTATGT